MISVQCSMFHKAIQTRDLVLIKTTIKYPKQGTNVAHNVRGGLLIDLTIVAIALLLRYTLSMSLKLTDMSVQ